MGKQVWIQGLIGAFTTGLCNAALVKLTDMGFDITRDWKQLLVTIGVGTLVATLSYLKQSPLPFYTFEGGTVPVPDGVTVDKPGVLSPMLIAGFAGMTLLGLSLSGCETPEGASNFKPLIRPTASLSTIQLIQGVGSEAKQEETAKQAYAVAYALRTLSAGQAVDPDQIDPTLRSVITKEGTSREIKALQDQLIILVSSIYASYYPQFKDDGQLAIEILNLLAHGIEDGAKTFLNADSQDTAAFKMRTPVWPGRIWVCMEKTGSLGVRG